MNVAVGLGRLGVQTELLSEVGVDADGDLIIEHLRESGVDVDSVARRGVTSSARARLDDGGAADYLFDVSWALETTPSNRSAILHTAH